MTSNGNSTREAGQIQLRRRLHSGFTASLQYTFSKSIDDDAVLGGQGASASTPDTPLGAGAASSVRNLLIAQNWLDLSAERGLSTFDQRHLLNAADAVHHRHGNRRRNAAERLEGRAVQRVDRSLPRSRPAADCR